MVLTCTSQFHPECARRVVCVCVVHASSKYKNFPKKQTKTFPIPTATPTKFLLIFSIPTSQHIYAAVCPVPVRIISSPLYTRLPQSFLPNFIPELFYRRAWSVHSPLGFIPSHQTLNIFASAAIEPTNALRVSVASSIFRLHIDPLLPLYTHSSFIFLPRICAFVLFTNFLLSCLLTFVVSTTRISECVTHTVRALHIARSQHIFSCLVLCVFVISVLRFSFMFLLWVPLCSQWHIMSDSGNAERV